MKWAFCKTILPMVGLLIICFHMAPFYIALILSLKKKTDFSSRWLMPDYLYLDNFRIGFIEAELARAFTNSIVITALSTALIVVLGSMAAYPLSRVKSRMNKAVLMLVLAVMMIPTLSVIVPLYSVMSELNAVNTFWGIVLLLTTYNCPMAIFLYANFIGSIPKDLDEAATVDGCGNFGVFFRIILPQLKPITATVVILLCVKNWNDFEFALYFLQKPVMETITLAIRAFFSEYTADVNVAAAVAIIAVIPMVVLFFVLQKFFVSGLMEGAVKS